MRIALVHDYLKEFGGAERVLEALHEMFPEAPVFTAYYDPKGLKSHNEVVKHWDIKTSWMQKIPFGNRFISFFRIFAPATFENFDLTPFDLVISSSSTYFANAVITSPSALHINYIHTPPRFLYGYVTAYNYKKHWWTRIPGEVANHFLRLWDFEIAQRPDVLVANSKNIKKRIAKFYRRDSMVTYPPVDVEKLKTQMSKVKTTTQNSKFYYLAVGRLVRGKGIEVIVKACTDVGLPLKVIGSGPLEKELKKIAGKNVEFLGHVKDDDLAEIYAGAKATIVASIDEDFGIVPVESMACGTPVIAFASGGFLETVTPGKTGEFFEKVTVAGLEEALKKFKSEKYNIKDCQKNAQKFTRERFKKEMMDLINKSLKK